uniref:FMN-dependent NADH-azoreductase n=1 Tax=Lygus hesperus TaxID=30085 RepID=A0A0A9XK71_LYGHE
MELAKAAFANASSLHEVFKLGNDDDDKLDKVGSWFNFNNLGVLSLHEGKPAVASLCFANAYNNAPSHLKQVIGYNYGLCDLLRGDFNAAISTFSTLTSMYQSPLY